MLLQQVAPVQDDQATGTVLPAGRGRRAGRTALCGSGSCRPATGHLAHYPYTPWDCQYAFTLTPHDPPQTTPMYGLRRTHANANAAWK